MPLLESIAIAGAMAAAEKVPAIVQEVERPLHVGSELRWATAFDSNNGHQSKDGGVLQPIVWVSHCGDSGYIWANLYHGHVSELDVAVARDLAFPSGWSGKVQFEAWTYPSSTDDFALTLIRKHDCGLQLTAKKDLSVSSDEGYMFLAEINKGTGVGRIDSAELSASDTAKAGYLVNFFGGDGMVYWEFGAGVKAQRQNGSYFGAEARCRLPLQDYAGARRTLFSLTYGGEF